MIRLGRTYDNYILFIIFIKILFIICAISTFLLKMKIKMSKNNIIINIDDTSDSNITEEEAGKIIYFYLYDFV